MDEMSVADRLRNTAASYLRGNAVQWLEDMNIDRAADILIHVPGATLEACAQRAASTAGIRDASVLAQRIYEYVTLLHVLGTPAAPRTLSMNYAAAAKRCGAPNLQELFFSLVPDRIRMVMRGRNKAWFNSSLLEAQKEQASLDGGNPHELVDNLIANSL